MWVWLCFRSQVLENRKPKTGFRNQVVQLTTTDPFLSGNVCRPSLASVVHFTTCLGFCGDDSGSEWSSCSEEDLKCSKISSGLFSASMIEVFRFNFIGRILESLKSWQFTMTNMLQIRAVGGKSNKSRSGAASAQIHTLIFILNFSSNLHCSFQMRKHVLTSVKSTRYLKKSRTRNIFVSGD